MFDIYCWVYRELFFSDPNACATQENTNQNNYKDRPTIDHGLHSDSTELDDSMQIRIMYPVTHLMILMINLFLNIFHQS